jgi:hypothetical protein
MIPSACFQASSPEFSNEGIKNSVKQKGKIKMFPSHHHNIHQEAIIEHTDFNILN